VERVHNSSKRKYRIARKENRFRTTDKLSNRKKRGFKVNIEKIKSLAGKIYWDKFNTNKTARQCVILAERKLKSFLPDAKTRHAVQLYVGHGEDV